MPKQPKRHIAVSPLERVRLEEAKKRYEERRGAVDWGGFLNTVVFTGLAALGIYTLAKILNHSEKSANIVCSSCGYQFLVAFPVNRQTQQPALFEVDCPQCNTTLLVDLARG